MLAGVASGLSQLTLLPSAQATESRCAAMRHCIRLHNSEKGLACTWWIWLVGGVSATCVAAIDIGRPQTAWLVLRSNSTLGEEAPAQKRQHCEIARNERRGTTKLVLDYDPV